MSTNCENVKNLYLHLMKQVLSQSLWNEPELVPVAEEDLKASWSSSQPPETKSGNWFSRRRTKTMTANEVFQSLTKSGFRICREQTIDEAHRANGTFWPPRAETMIGMKRLDNLQFCLEDVIRCDVPGDFIETGVWRGGACIFAQAILKAHECTGRNVWVADSFKGLPPPNPELYPADKGDEHHTHESLRISREQVEQNFRRYGMMDTNVKFLHGWFRDTLPAAPIEKLAVVRLDGDMYESTMDGLKHLYPKLVPGGYLIVDDYGAVEACRKAVEDYRTEQKIEDKIQTIDWTGIYWQKR
jgi:O-methyltransferase